jgi:Fic family protein
MSELISGWNDALEDRRLHPLLAVAAFNLDFLCIHPFRDGNGRVSRLLLLLQCYLLGFEVGRHISIERIASGRSRRREERRARSSSTPSAKRPVTSASPTSSANAQGSAST